MNLDLERYKCEGCGKVALFTPEVYGKCPGCPYPHYFCSACWYMHRFGGLEMKQYLAKLEGEIAGER